MNYLCESIKIRTTAISPLWICKYRNLNKNENNSPAIIKSFTPFNKQTKRIVVETG